MDIVDAYGRLAWVIGKPIEHTLSPVIHNAAFEQADLPHRYFALEVADSELDYFFEMFDTLNFLGANVTLPLKKAVIEYADIVPERVNQIGAANTLYWKSESIALDNTDVNGFRTLVEPWENTIVNNGLVLLGAGGAARACLYALKEMSCQRVYLWNRTTRTARELKEGFPSMNIQVLGDDDLHDITFDTTVVVNATSLGLKPDDPSPFPKEQIRDEMVGIDLIYNVNTQFLSDFESQGCDVRDGTVMLVSQAARSWELWTGQSPDTSIMFDALKTFS